MNLVLLFSLGFAAGMFANSLINFFIYLKKKCGVLKIDRSNPEKDTYRFEIDKLEDLNKRNFIILRIENDADLSRK